jgi:hypothetical protein
VLQGDHRAACHYAEQALQSDVGVSHVVSDHPLRRGTPAGALPFAHRSEADRLDAPAEDVLPTVSSIETPPTGTTGGNGATPSA